MVEFPFEEDDDPLTTGRGTFLDSITAQYSMADTLLCNGFLADKPPHNADYFSSQMLAVKNYYDAFVNEDESFEIHMIDSVYTTSKPMREYALGDSYLGEFFKESVELAKGEIEDLSIDLNNAIIVIFHAGMGQDFAVPLIDPTSHDLKSAYVDEEILNNVEPILINSIEINRGIILPETQNMIYYDVVQDIFSGTSDLCDIQVGLTGTFALLLGYAFDLPPLFNTESGMAGVGVFGLMDHGSNNGRGVIPSPPSPWTRIQKGWSNSITIDNDTTLSISIDESLPTVYRVDINNDEFFLIENRNNWIQGESADIDSLRRKEEHKISDEQVGHWFDTVLAEFSEEEIELTNGVITKFKNYDVGLPGSGILIWHINDKLMNANQIGVNNNPGQKAISIEEADGSVDVGYSSAHPLFTQHVNGWKFDYWYADNFYYFEYGNPEEKNNDNDYVVFDDFTRPNSSTMENVHSGIKFTVMSEPNHTMDVEINFNEFRDFEQSFIHKNDVEILGDCEVNDTSFVFYKNETGIYKTSVNSQELISENLNYNLALCTQESIELIEFDSNSSLFAYYNEELIFPTENFVVGFLTNSTQSEDYTEKKVSLGDIDNDGLDELIYVSDSSLVVENYPNNVDANGFPVHGSFYHQPLIADIINTDEDFPEIICREENGITILNHIGERILEIPSFSPDQQLSIIPNWKDERAALVDGHQLLLFDFDADDSFWLHEYSQNTNYPMVTGDHLNTISTSTPTIEFYNYPNPIKNGSTTFRFYVKESSEIVINIYDILGLKVDSITKENLQNNEYNEVQWSATHIDPGVYFAHIKFDSDNVAMTKVMVLK